MALALERAQLREQAVRNELLEEVDRLQRALVGAVSHDLRTPLATIKASASTLRNAAANVSGPERQELLALIETQSDRLDRLVTNLLDVSRVQAGALEVRHEPISVRDLVAEAVRAMGPATGPFTVSTSLDDDLPLVDVDHLLIGQVLANLLDNASRYAPPGTTITISACRRPDGLVELGVQDEGPGVSPIATSRCLPDVQPQRDVGWHRGGAVDRQGLRGGPRSGDLGRGAPAVGVPASPSPCRRAPVTAVVP